MEKSIHHLSHSSEHQHQQYLEREQEAHVAVQTLEQSRVELECDLSHMRLQLASVKKEKDQTFSGEKKKRKFRPFLLKKKKEKDQTISGTHTQDHAQDHAHINTQHY